MSIWNGNRDIKVLVFDDDPNREQSYMQMADAGDIEVVFINLKDKDTSYELKRYLNEDNDPDIIFIDHVLDKTAVESAKFMRTGKCISPILRDKWLRTPIVAVTAAKEDCIKRDGYTFYEEIFDVKDISQLDDFLRPIVTGYRMLKGVSDIDRFVELLRAPAREIKSIIHSMPDEMQDLESDSFVHEIFRWFRRIFYHYPGFLYDEKWTATTIGIDVNYLSEYSTKIETAKYEGIWADPNQPRWWKKSLYGLALKNRSNARETVQSAAARALEIRVEHHSRCFRCGKEWPETLAYTDESPILAELVPAHLECSTLHAKRHLSLSFEEPRIIIE